MILISRVLFKVRICTNRSRRNRENVACFVSHIHKQEWLTECTETNLVISSPTLDVKFATSFIKNVIESDTYSTRSTSDVTKFIVEIKCIVTRCSSTQDCFNLHQMC